MANLTTTIEIDVDASGVIAGSSQAASSFTGAVKQMQTAGNTAIPNLTRQSNEFDKSLNRLANSRAPQFMGLLTSQAVASIPALQGSAAAMGLAQVAVFGLQRALASLAGPAGVILLAITALAIFASKTKEAKQATDPLNESLETLGQRYLKMQELGIVATATQIALRNRIDELEQRISQLNKTTALSTIELEKWGLANLSAADQEKLFGGVVQKSTEEIEKTNLELKIYQKNLNDFNTKKALEELERWTEANEAARRALFEEPFALKVPLRDESAATKAMEKLHKQYQQNQQDIQDDIDTLSRFYGALADKRIAQEQRVKQAQQQSIQEIVTSFEGAFAEMLAGGQVAWDRLLQYWYSKLLASAVFSLITKLFGFSFGGFFKELFSFQSGTHYVPRTGAYMLHQGEAVVPANRNPYVSNINNNMGGNTYIVNVRQALDSDTIKTKLIPELKRVFEGRGISF